MAVDRPLISELKAFAYKVETTTGTPISLAAADGTFWVRNPAISPAIPYHDREGVGPSLDHFTGVVGARAANVSFTTEVVGKGSSGVPSWATLLAAAGLTLSTATYISTSPPDSTTITVGCYEDGAFFSAAGVRLNGVIRGTVGEPCLIDWTGQGCWQDPSAVAIIAPTYVTTLPPVLEDAVFTIGGTEYMISDFTLDIGAQVVLREDINSASGYHAAAIVSRTPKFTCSPERLGLGTKNWYTTFTGNTTAALSLLIGTATNNKITLTAAAMQLTNVTPGDRNGIITDQLEFQLNGSAGDDSLQVLFS